jgi:hypothetical protein
MNWLMIASLMRWLDASGLAEGLDLGKSEYLSVSQSQKLMFGDQFEPPWLKRNGKRTAKEKSPAVRRTGSDHG